MKKIRIIAALAALVILAGYLIGIRVTEQVIKFIEGCSPALGERTGGFRGNRFKAFGALKYLPQDVQITISRFTDNVQEYLGNFIGTVSEPTLEALGNFAKNLPNIVISVIMCLLFAYFCVAEREYIPNLLERILPQSLLERWHMIKRGLARAVGGYFKAQLKIEIWMYVLLAIGFTVLKVDYAFIIAIGVAFLDLLPFLGRGPC